MGGIFDSIKTMGRSIWNVAKQPIRGLWAGTKAVDSVVSNPLVETGVSLAQPELSPFFAGYNVGKYVLDKLGGGFLAKQLDNL